MTDTQDSAGTVESTEAPSSPVVPSPSSPAESPQGGDGGSIAEPPAEESILDLEIPQGVKTFDRTYVEKLRAEAAANRTKAREAETTLQERQEQLARFEAFDGYSDEDMQIWTKMASDWKAENYTEAAQMMQQIAQNVLGDPTSSDADKQAAQDVLDDPNVEAAANLTPEDIRRIAREESESLTSEQKAAAEREQAVEHVFEKVRAAGYEDGSPESFQVLWYANNKTEGDIDAAIKMQHDAEQAIVDRYVESLGKGGSPVRMPSGGGGGTPVGEAPKNMTDARRQAQAFLDERYAQGG